MNKKRLQYITIAMIVALVGIIVIQGFWIKNAYSAIREKFFREIESKLDDVIDKHEVLLTLDLIEDIDQRGFTGISNFENQKKVLANVDSSEVVFKKYTVDIEEVLFEPNTEKLVRIKSGDRKSNTAPEDSLSYSPNGRIDKIELKKDSHLVDFAELKMDSEGQLFRLLRSFLATYPKVDKITVERELDSLINIEMSRFSPSLNFRYEILDYPADTFNTFIESSEKDNLAGVHIKKKLFPSSTTPHNMHLLVNVVDPVRVVLSQMKMILILSILFLVIIVYSFVYTLSTLVRQGKLSQMKSDFINNMTHELKTPITTISLATEALLDRSIEMSPEKVNNMSRLISKENNRLKSQVERVLQMERLDRNKIKLDVAEHKLNEFLKEILENVSIQVESKGGQINWALKAETDLVSVDELHIGNVIYNLIDNAIKYSKERIEIFVTTYAVKDQVFIDIEDKGVGIPKELLPRVFERFYRVPTGNLHDVKGFGLGLSYVKEMMQLHKGDVKVASQINKGSTFTLVFPINKQHQ
ncbi:MAG: sensor histidine kinase [Bacteroidia bacterium]